MACCYAGISCSFRRWGHLAGADLPRSIDTAMEAVGQQAGRLGVEGCRAIIGPSLQQRQLAVAGLNWGGSRGIGAWELRRGRSRGFLSLSGELKVPRRQVVNAGVAAGLVACSSALLDTSSSEQMATASTGIEKLPFKEDGYNFWNWRGHKVHYVVEGEGSPIVLIHGFGASAFHWRYNIPELAKSHKVYAMDLLGFGWSEKALVDYSALVWRDQVNDFVEEVVGGPATLVGNSVGGFTVLLAAANRPDLTSGLVLVNASGQFETPGEEKKQAVVEETAVQRLIITPVKTVARKWLIWFAFWQAKQPSRIRSVLNNVYKDQSNVDDYLVQSIVQPAQDPNAFEVYYRLMTQVLLKPSDLSLNKLLSQLSVPLLLLWGELDPWMGPAKADKIVELYPSATLIRLTAGHCPHDEAPERVNEELTKWVASIAHG